MDWPSVAVGGSTVLAVVLLGASSAIRFTWNHRRALIEELEKERCRRVAAERGMAEVLDSMTILTQALEKATAELARTLTDIVFLRAENKRLRHDAGPGSGT